MTVNVAKMNKGCKVNTVKRNDLKYENAMAIVKTFEKPHKLKSTIAPTVVTPSPRICQAACNLS